MKKLLKITFVCFALILGYSFTSTTEEVPVKELDEVTNSVVNQDSMFSPEFLDLIESLDTNPADEMSMFGVRTRCYGCSEGQTVCYQTVYVFWVRFESGPQIRAC